MTDDYTNNEIFPKNFNIYRLDREGKRGGGVFIGVRNHYNSSLKWTDPDFEIIAVTINTGIKKISVMGAYRPPDCNPLQFLDTLGNHLSTVRKNGVTSRPVIVGGDLNLPQVLWEQKPEASTGAVQNTVYSMLDDHDMMQVITEPTHAPNNILDVFLVSPPEIVIGSLVEPGISDHKLITLDITVGNIPPSPPKPDQQAWNYSKVDLPGITSFLQESFHEWSTQQGDINNYWTSFKTLLDLARTRYIPQRRLRRNGDPVYYNKEVKALKIKCRKAYPERRSKQEEFKNLVKKLNEAKKAALKVHMQSLLNIDGPGNWSKFYKHVNSKKGNHNSIPTLKTPETTAITDSNKANLLNSIYQKVFNSNPKWHIANHVPADSDTMPSAPNSFTISDKTIERALSKLKFKTGAGPDGVSSQMLKITRLAVIPYLKTLFNISINNNQIPHDWTVATIHPIFKSGTRSDPTNYRPVGNTSIPCKLMERSVVDYSHSQWAKANWLFKNQHGFRQQYSCESSLAGFTQELAEHLDNGKQVDAILVDFSKAFDTVPHSILMEKFSAMELDNRVVNWIGTFLTNRTQRVKVGNSLSDPVNITSGVPQGTVLGPTLFLGFINDVTKKIDSRVKLFADDLIVYRVIEDMDDQRKLQADVDCIYKWVEENGMKLNAAKTTVVSFTTRRSPKETSYSINGEALAKSRTCKYLGVTLSSNLSWSTHIAKMTSKAIKSLHFVMRNLKNSYPKTKQHAYLSLVRPLLEYCSAIWDPHSATHITAIEKVQRKAARYVTNCHRKWCKKSQRPHVSTSKIVNELKWDKLETRRKRVSLRYLFKALSGQPAWSDLVQHVQEAEFVGHSDHNKKLFLERYNSGVGRYSLLGRAVRLWNGLPKKEMNSLGSFKHFNEILKSINFSDIS